MHFMTFEEPIEELKQFLVRTGYSQNLKTESEYLEVHETTGNGLLCGTIIKLTIARFYS